MSASKKLVWSKVKAILGTKKVVMASVEEVTNVTQCLPGAVPPFGSLFKIETLLDQSLID